MPELSFYERNPIAFLVWSYGYSIRNIVRERRGMRSNVLT